MTRKINIKPIKRKFLNARGYKKNNWTCDLEIIKTNGKVKIIKGIEFMKTQELKRDAIEKANEYKEYMLSRGDFYFV